MELYEILLYLFLGALMVLLSGFIQGMITIIVCAVIGQIIKSLTD